MGDRSRRSLSRDGYCGACGTANDNSYQMIKIYVPELQIQNCLHFLRNQLIWTVKQKILASLPTELPESFNYGLLRPPGNDTAANFLDEQLKLNDYPLDTVAYLELKYKQRIYKMLYPLSEKQLKLMQTRANRLQLAYYVTNANADGIRTVCALGMEPNFHSQETGETPLTLATSIQNPAAVLVALVTGGAYLDYRALDGTTALHRAVLNKSMEAVRTLLELGASPNYKDAHGLTPLHLAVTLCVTDVAVNKTERHEHPPNDNQNTLYYELRRACLIKLDLLFQRLIQYGADVNACNASGNTPLHLCALNDNEHFAEKLLALGCDRIPLNHSYQTPYEVAVIAGNYKLSDVILNYPSKDAVSMWASNRWSHRSPSRRWYMLPSDPESERSPAPGRSTNSQLRPNAATASNATATGASGTLDPQPKPAKISVRRLSISPSRVADRSETITQFPDVTSSSSDSDSQPI